MVFLLLFGLLLTFLKCNAREINIAGLITTHTQFDTQQNLEILIFEGLPDNKASYAVCDVFPTEARLITSGDVVRFVKFMPVTFKTNDIKYYCIDYGVRDVNSDDITIDFMNGINLPFHISWEARKALYDSGDVNFTYEFKFSEFESLTSYDLQFRQYK